MMGSQYTTVYRWGGHKRADARGVLRHALRSTLVNETHSHSNENIDPMRTAENKVFTADGKGGFVEGGSIDDWMDKLNAKIDGASNSRLNHKTGEVTRVAVRKDASVLIETILQLDPEFTGRVVDMSEDLREETEEFLSVMIEEVVKQTGAENILGYAIHWDEKSPHVQMFSIPMIEGNVLCATRFNGGPGKAASQKKYVERQDAMRYALKDAGYDATMERVSQGRKHLTVDEYKSFKEQSKSYGSANDSLRIGQKLNEQGRRANRLRRSELESERDEFKRMRSRELDRLEDMHARFERDMSDLTEKTYRQAYESGRSDGYSAGLRSGQAEVLEEKAKLKSSRDAYDQEREGLAELSKSYKEAIATIPQAVKQHKIMQNIKAIDDDVQHQLNKSNFSPDF